jgi:hypothetical protein
MIRHQHSSTSPGVLQSLLIADPSALPPSPSQSPKVIQFAVDAKSVCNRLLNSTTSSNSTETRGDEDGDNDKLSTTAKTSPAVDDNNSLPAVATVEAGSGSTVIGSREYDSSDDDDGDDETETDSKHHRSVDNTAASVSTTLDVAVKRQLLAMLPNLMSAANYKRLVDEGHLKSAEQDDAGTGSQVSQQLQLLTDEKTPDVVAASVKKMPTPKKPVSPSAGDEIKGQETMRTSPRDRSREALTLTTSEQGESGLSIYACHICDFVCEYILHSPQLS